MGIRSAVITAGMAMGVLTACGSATPTCPEDNRVFGVPVCGEEVATSQGVQVSSNAGSIAEDFTAIQYNDNGTPNDTSDDTMRFVGGDFDGDNDYVRDPGFDRGGMLAFINEFQEQEQLYYATYGQTTSEAITVYLAATPDNFTEGDYLAGFVRSSSSNIPSEGNANYAGTYTGVATNQEGGGAALVEGEAIIFVEFSENGRTKGRIENRSVVGISSSIGVAQTELERDIILNEGTLNSNNITESGTTTTFDGSGTSVGTGTWVAAVGGPNGSEIGGYLETTRQIGEIGTREFGIFVADCVPGTELTCNPN